MVPAHMPACACVCKDDVALCVFASGWCEGLTRFADARLLLLGLRMLLLLLLLLLGLLMHGLCVSNSS